jgi:hypothetical protein
MFPTICAQQEDVSRKSARGVEALRRVFMTARIKGLPSYDGKPQENYSEF